MTLIICSIRHHVGKVSPNNQRENPGTRVSSWRPQSWVAARRPSRMRWRPSSWVLAPNEVFSQAWKKSPLSLRLLKPCSTCAIKATALSATRQRMALTDWIKLSHQPLTCLPSRTSSATKLPLILFILQQGRSLLLTPIGCKDNSLFRRELGCSSYIFWDGCMSHSCQT